MIKLHCDILASGPKVKYQKDQKFHSERFSSEIAVIHVSNQVAETFRPDEPGSVAPRRWFVLIIIRLSVLEHKNPLLDQYFVYMGVPINKVSVDRVALYSGSSLQVATKMGIQKGWQPPGYYTFVPGWWSGHITSYLHLLPREVENEANWRKSSHRCRL